MADSPSVTLFLCGDVMTGRGVDQILPHPCEPRLYERGVQSATRYVELVERVSGRIDTPVDFAYIWGDALAQLERVRPDARIANLETAVTTSEDAWPGKGIHYRMNPANIACLTAARLDCCVLANNHVMDWGRAGLAQTLESLHAAGLRTAGAGTDDAAANAPAVIEPHGGSRVLVYAAAVASSGVPAEWAARTGRAGVSFLPDLSPRHIDALARRVQRVRRAGDLVVFSIHWGANWDLRIAAEERAFAHGLIEAAGVDLVHGHSAHHVKGIEVFRDRLVLYGCGDLLNDYEGIGGQEDFRPELSLMYFPTLEVPGGRLTSLAMVPMRMRRMRIENAGSEGRHWLARLLRREGEGLGTNVDTAADGTIRLWWK